MMSQAEIGLVKIDKNIDDRHIRELGSLVPLLAEKGYPTAEIEEILTMLWQALHRLQVQRRAIVENAGRRCSATSHCAAGQADRNQNSLRKLQLTSRPGGGLEGLLGRTGVRWRTARISSTMSDKAAIKSERGTKRTCQNPDCGARFYDLIRDPITCPNCNTVYAIAFQPPPQALARPAPRPLKRPAPVPRAVKEELPTEES